jgi:hypothetical protein
MIALVIICGFFFNGISLGSPSLQDKKNESISALVLLGEWFGDAYFPLKEEIDRRGWAMKNVGIDIEYRGCYNKKRDVVLRSDILIRDLEDFSSFDCLIIPSGPQWRKFNANPQVLQFVRDARAAGLLIASFCVGNLTVKAAGLVDFPIGPDLFPAEVTKVKERILLGPRGGGPPPGDGFASAPIKEICDAIARELESMEDDESFPVLKGPYLGQKPPGMVPEIFAPGIISNCDLHSSVYFSPDGDEIYFSKLKGSWNVMCMKQENGRWSPPQFLCKGLTPFLSPDGKTLFFSTQDWALWKMKRSAFGWAEPVNLGPVINFTQRQDGPSVTRDGTLYYCTHYRNANGIVRSTFENGHYSEPQPLGSGINNNHNEGFPFIAPDESYIIFSSFRPGSYGLGDLYISFRRDDGRWTEPRNLGSKINSEAKDRFPCVSPDGKFFFFNSSRVSILNSKKIPDGPGNVFWVDAGFIKALKPNKLR